MTLILACFCAALLLAVTVVWAKRTRDRETLQRHSVTPEMLHSLLESDQEILVFDVRQPLDLLAYPEVIPGARRIPPDEILERPSLIPKDKDTVVYCTCPGDKTSRQVLRHALALQFCQIKFLKGGLAAWKQKGYPVEPYRESFHLYARVPVPTK